MVDLHSHILWGIDDGSKSREMTLEMLKMAEKSGTTTIVATPHYLRDRYEVKYSELHDRFKELTSIIEEEDINLKVKLGQEVYYCENILELYENGEIGCIEGTNYMLIELPMREFNVDEVCDVLYELQVRGINIIIAHPERYKPFLKDNKLINKFIREGYLFQLNGGSVVEDFGKDIKKLAEFYLESGVYSFLGSDGHRDEMRNTDLSRVRDYLDSSIERVFKDNGEVLLEGKTIENNIGEIKIKKKGIFAFLKR